MTILVTGAAGFLGGHVVDVLCERGEQVRAFVRPGEDTSRLEALGVEVRRGDLSDEATVRDAVRDSRWVLHCAAKTGPWGPMDEYMAANVTGVRLLALAAMDAGVERFIHVSSITVHGNDVRGTANELSPTPGAPNPYSRTKLAGERVLAKLISTRNAPITIVRPGWIYGPRDSASFGRFTSMIEHGKMVVMGSGSNVIPLIHARDVARGMVLAAEKPEAIGGVFLLVSDERITQSRYLNDIASELGVAPPRLHIPYAGALALGIASESVYKALHIRRSPPLTRYGLEVLGGENRFDIARARRELGFAPSIPFADGVRESVAWYRASSRSPLMDSASSGESAQKRAALKA
ncbi:MAG TPA: NAD-dependent epimerase/dehydratase family protein [Ktedonobacterales bacterium]|jgi:nucleoside-diphosphate-sugar epimerase|nr:NAD-dependent epimerase/dehydratase family protein [Ktedonobacterales bacterium]